MLKKLREAGFLRPLLTGRRMLSEHFNIGRRMIALLCCTTLLVISAITLSFWSFKQVSDLDQLRHLSRLEISKINDLLSALKDAETGQRDYLLTGDDHFLAPVNTLNTLLPQRLQDLHAASPQVISAKLLQDIDRVIHARMAELASAIELKRHDDTAGAIALMNSSSGKKLVDALNADVTNIFLEAHLRLEQARQQARTNQRHLFEGIVATSLMALLMSLATAFFIQRSARHYVSKLQLVESKRLLDLQRQSNHKLWQSHLLLMKNREQLRAFIQHAPVSIAMFDLDMNYLEVSDSWRANFESNNTQLYGQHHYALHPAMPEKWKIQHRQCLSGSTLKNDNDMWTKPDGSVHWTSWSMQPWQDESGVISGIIIAAEDITERRNAESLRREYDNRLRGVINSAMDAIITIDDSFQVQLINPAACKMFGITEAEALAGTIERFIPERYRHRHNLQVQSFGQSGIPSRHLEAAREIVGLRADGTEFPAEASISQVTVNGKKLFTVVIRDQTSRRRIEKALRDSEAFTVAILNSVVAEIAVLDSEGTIIAVNQAWRRFAQQNSRHEGSLPANSQPGSNYLAACTHGDALAAQASTGIRSVMEGTSPSFSMTYPCHSDTVERWFVMSVTPMGTQDGNVVIAHTDVSSTKAAEKALQESQSMLRDLLDYQHRIKEEERIRMAREIHDELGTRLIAIKANLSVVMDQDQRSGAGENPLLNEASRMLDLSVETVRNVLFDLRPSVLDNLGIWPALEWYAGQTAKRTGMFCDFSIEPTLEEFEIAPDLSNALFRILQETLANIVSHARATEFAVSLRLEQQSIIMEVEDNGGAIDPEKIRQLTSWGIAGMAERARYLGGSVAISHKAHGMLVTLSLPLEMATA